MSDADGTVPEEHGAATIPPPPKPPREAWRPSFADYLGIGGFVVAIIVWLTEPNWQRGGVLALVAIALIVAAAMRHQAPWPLRAVVASIIIALFVWAIWPRLWGSFQEDYPEIAFQWPITFGVPLNPGPNAPGPSEPIIPTQSRADRFIFACDVAQPQTPEDNAKQKEQLKHNIQAWGDTLGINISFSDIKNSDGLQVTVEAKTSAAKSRFISMGILAGITKVFLETRWITQRLIVVVYADVPKNTIIDVSGIIPSPLAPQIISGQKLIAQFLGAPDDACHLI